MQNPILRPVQEQIDKIKNPDFYVGKPAIVVFDNIKDIVDVEKVDYFGIIDQASYDLNIDNMVERNRRVGDRMILFKVINRKTGKENYWERADLAFQDDVINTPNGDFYLSSDLLQQGYSSVKEWSMGRNSYFGELGHLVLIGESGFQSPAFTALSTPTQTQQVSSSGGSNPKMLNRNEFAMEGDMVDFITSIGSNSVGKIVSIDVENDEVLVVDLSVNAINEEDIVGKKNIIRLYRERKEVESLNFLKRNQIEYAPKVHSMLQPNQILSQALKEMKKIAELDNNVWYFKKDIYEDDFAEFDTKLLKLIVLELRNRPEFFGNESGDVTPQALYFWLKDSISLISDNNMGIKIGEICMSADSDNRYLFLYNDTQKNNSPTDFACKFDVIDEKIFVVNPKTYNDFVQSVIYKNIIAREEKGIVSDEVSQDLMKIMKKLVDMASN